MADCSGFATIAFYSPRANRIERRLPEPSSAKLGHLSSRAERRQRALSSFGWRDTMLASAALCWAVALLLQPLRGRLDTEPSPRHPIRLSDLRTTITAVLAVRELRSLSFACFAFNGTQAVFVAYFVTYMTAQGYPLVAAGSLYSTVIAVALPGRILWAWVGGFYVAPHVVLGGLAFGMAVSIGLFGAVTPHWPLLVTGAVAMVVSVTAMSGTGSRCRKPPVSRRRDEWARRPVGCCHSARSVRW
jgi:hypothetical protein